MEMSNSVKTISAMSLFVEDLAAAKAFYQAIFDVPVVFEDDVAVVVKFDNLILNLLKTTSARTLIDPGVVAGPESGSRFQFSVWVDDVDAVCADLETRGARLLTRPTNRPWGMRTATFVDPAGHSWEIAQDLSKSATT
jgi:catechol 2,3-dioxygenase-like lactoylglutathione lyase family enzyme